MHKRTMIALVAGTLVGIAASTLAQSDVQATYDDIQKTFGFVPTMFRQVPAAALPGAWQEMKTVQMNPKTALPGKTKELIGLAVAAQVPCRYCTYFHTQAAKANGASDEEIKEAIAMAGLTRHWATVAYGNLTDMQAFKQEQAKMGDYMSRQQGGTGSMQRSNPPPNQQTPPPPSQANPPPTATNQPPPMQPTPPSNGQPMQPQQQNQPPTPITDAQSAYTDMRSRMGTVPSFMQKFPEEGVAGAWRMTRDLEGGPTALDRKTKELIILGVGAQMPCDYCVIHGADMARREGASDVEISEAIAMSAITRNWSTILNGSLMDENAFRRDTDRIMKRMRTEKTAPPTASR